MNPEEISNQMIELFFATINRLAPNLEMLFNDSKISFTDALADNNLEALKTNLARIKQALTTTQHNHEHNQAIAICDMVANRLEQGLPHAFILLYLKVFGFAGLAEPIKNNLLGRLESIGLELNNIIKKGPLINTLDTSMKNLYSYIKDNLPDSPARDLLLKLRDNICAAYVDIKTPDKPAKPPRN